MLISQEYPTIENRDAVDDCWEESYLRTIGKKCLESTKSLTKRSIGDQDLNLNMAGLCLLRHLSDNMKYAKKKVFGEEPEPFGGDFQHLIESVFEEARCEHANAGNIDRRQECNSCFNHVRNKVKFMRIQEIVYFLFQFHIFQCVPKKIAILSSFEFLGLGGVLIGVKKI